MPTSPATRLIPHLRRAVLAADAGGLSDGQLLGEYLRTRDDAAFAALVRRHGPMVLGVCRRVVGDVHAADDAFQAVFLVLARRAATVRPREQVGNFLFGVAYRTALKARALRARRSTREKQVSPMPHPLVPPPDCWPDLQPVLDAELARLPDKFRLPVVLCDLEGRPQREVARQLGLPPATLANRLAAARRTLAKRLTDRGIVLSGGAVATVVSANAAAAVPPALAAAATRMTTALAGSGLGTVPAHIVHLSDGVIRTMLITKLKSVAVAVTAACALAGGFGVGTLPALNADDAPAAAPKPATNARPALGPHLSDDQFLRRVCLDLRGTPPTTLELAIFQADPDPEKRKKVVNWLAAPGEVRPVVVDPIGTIWRQARVSDSSRSALEFSTSGPGRLVLKEWYDPTGSAAADVKQPPRAGEFAEIAWFLSGQPAQGQPPGSTPGEGERVQGRFKLTYLIDVNADEEFLKRVCQEAFGRAPTALEREYFLADQDPEKRSKLVDLVLRDAAVAKRVGSDWKNKLLQTGEWVVKLKGIFVDVGDPVPARLEALLRALLDGKRADAAVLDTLSAAVLGRLPTESEARLALSRVGQAADKAAAWREVLAALAGTEEARKHTAGTRDESPKPPGK